jgi:hypothetical protein
MLRNHDKYDFCAILDDIKYKLGQSDVSFTPDTFAKIRRIQEIISEASRVNDIKTTSNKRFLCDEKTADLLTLETLKIILSSIPYEPLTAIADIIYDGLKDTGIPAAAILENILMLAESLNMDIHDFSYSHPGQHDKKLDERLEAIASFISTHQPDPSLEQEARTGFYTIVDALGFNYFSEFNEEEIQSDIILTNKNNAVPFEISSLINAFFSPKNYWIFSGTYLNKYFFEASHLTAAIASNQKFIAEGKEIFIRDILKMLLATAEENHASAVYPQLKMRIRHVENYLATLEIEHRKTTPHPRYRLPDNALRMIQLLEKFRSHKNQAHVNSIIRRLTKAREEAHAELVFNELPEHLFSREQKEPLSMAALTNEALLREANININHPVLKEKYLREIAGRLLRKDKHPNTLSDIETRLRNDAETHQHIIDSLHRDFLAHTRNIRSHFTAENGRIKGGAEKSPFLAEILRLWKNPTGNPQDDLYVLRDNLLVMQEKMPLLKGITKIERHPLQDFLFAALVALGCIALPIIGVPITFYAMHQSRRDKGTVFFTHAPETMKIPRETEKALRKLGRV